MVLKRDRQENDDRGVAIALVALTLTLLMGVSALVIDLGMDRQLSRNEQASTDAAALAAAQDLPKGTFANNGMANQARATARSYMAQSLNGSASGSGCTPDIATCTFNVGDYRVTVTTPYSLAGSPYASHNLVYVRACTTSPALLSRAWSSDGREVCRSSVARNRNIVEGFGRGLVALNPTACPSLEFSGSSTTNLHSTGAIIVESDCTPNALDGGGNAWEVQAGLITVVGGYQINPCTELTCLNGTMPTTGVAPTGDPLGSLPEPVKPVPAVSPATAPGISPISGQPCTMYQPGFYQTININSGSACFAPGIYYLEQTSDTADAFRSNGNGFLHGNGVTFFVKRGAIALNGTGSLRLNPPVAGTYAGISIFQARSNTAPAKINGNDDSSIGTIYLPEAHLEFQGNAGSSSGDFVTGMVIADTVTITGNGYLKINADEPDVVQPPEDDLGLQL